jgi:hypothetical protein
MDGFNFFATWLGLLSGKMITGFSLWPCKLLRYATLLLVLAQWWMKVHRVFD